MMASNTTFCFGLGKKYEVGFNILGVTYDNDEKKIISNPIDEQPVYPSLSINMQKLILENKHYSLAMGGQLAFPAVPSEFEYYIYLNNKFELKKTVLVAGLYYGNDTYFGNETRFSNLVQDIGIQLGLEFEIVKNRWYFQADCFSGQTPISNVIIGGAYKFTKHLILSAGFQRPNTKRTSANGLVLELTYIQ